MMTENTASSANKFAKLFEFDDIGQVLVMMRASNEDEAEDGEKLEAKIEISAMPDGLGVCTIRLFYRTWERADKAFEGIDEVSARAFADKIIEMANPFVEAQDAEA